MSIITGKIVEVPFINKGGHLIEGAESLFFEVKEQRYFIKIQAGKITREALKKLLGQRVKIEGETAYGTWDSDDPKAQSRIGKYVVVFEIL